MDELAALGETVHHARPSGTTRDERIVAEHLVKNQVALTEAYHNARVLGRQLLECFDTMDATRRELEAVGLHINFQFDMPEVQVALNRHRTVLEGDLEVPEWVRR